MQKLLGKLSEKVNRGELSITEDAWHYRIVYQWWLRHTSSDKIPTQGYEENLCHYMRVCLIWAPLLWFFIVPCVPVQRFQWVRPWIIALAVVSIVEACIGMTFAPTQLAIGISAGIFAVIASLTALLVRWYQKDPEHADERLYVICSTIGNVFAAVFTGFALLVLIITGPVWGPFYAFNRWVWTPRFKEWFYHAQVLYVLRPWIICLTLVLAGAFTASVQIWGLGKTLVAIGIACLGVIGFCVAVAAGVTVLLLLNSGIEAAGTALENRIAAKKMKQSQSSLPSKPKGTPTLSLLWSYIWAQHYLICPRIKLPARVQPASQDNTELS